MQWLGPRGFSGKIITLDANTGGFYRYHLRSAEGTDHWMQGVHREVVEPERLVYTYVWTDADGNPTRPETLVTIVFEALGEKTRLTLRQEVFESVTARDAHNVGWSTSFDRLEEFLAKA